MSEPIVPAEPIYKGATRPPMIFGVPLIAFLVVAGGDFLAGMYLMVYVSVAWLLAVFAFGMVIILWMRALTRKDDQRLRQALLAARLAIGCPNREFWACRSYSPFVLRGAGDAWRR